VNTDRGGAVPPASDRIVSINLVKPLPLLRVWPAIATEGDRAEMSRTGNSPLTMVNAEVSGHLCVYAVHLWLSFTRRSWGPFEDHLALRWALSAVPASVTDCASGCG